MSKQKDKKEVGPQHQPGEELKSGSYKRQYTKHTHKYSGSGHFGMSSGRRENDAFIRRLHEAMNRIQQAREA